MEAWDEIALTVYSIGRQVLQEARAVAEGVDEVRWLCEDLEEALLDLKQSTLADEPGWVRWYIVEVRSLVSEIMNRIGE